MIHNKERLRVDACAIRGVTEISFLLLQQLFLKYNPWVCDFQTDQREKLLPLKAHRLGRHSFHSGKPKHSSVFGVWSSCYFVVFSMFSQIRSHLTVFAKWQIVACVFFPVKRDTKSGKVACHRTQDCMRGCHVFPVLTTLMPEVTTGYVVFREIKAKTYCVPWRPSVCAQISMFHSNKPKKQQRIWFVIQPLVGCALPVF